MRVLAKRLQLAPAGLAASDADPRVVFTHVSEVAEPQWTLANYRFGLESRDGGYVVSWSGAEPIEAEQLLLDQVIPRLVSREPGRLAFHASAVSFGHGILALVGRQGIGKSSLAHRAAMCGASWAADDALVIERAGAAPLALPNYPFSRLRDSALGLLGQTQSTLRVRDKGLHRWPAAQPGHPHWMILEAGQKTELTTLRRRTALENLVDSLRVWSNQVNGRIAEDLLAVLAGTDTYRLTIGRGFDELQRAVDLLQRVGE